jgi:hypothetical protein
MRRVNLEGERTEMTELTKNAVESDSIAAQSSLPTGTPDPGIRCRAMV